MNCKRKLKLLYFHPTIVFGGAERTTITLLKGLEKAVFDVLFVTKKGIFPPLPVKGVIYIDDLGISDGFKGIDSLIKDTKIMIQFIKEEKPDMVFGMLHYACIMLSLVKVFLRNKVKVIISPRTPSGAAINFYFRGKILKKALWNFMVKFFCQHSDCIIVASNGIKEECISKYKAKRNKIVIINNSINVQSVERFSMGSVNKKDSPDHFVISTAGRVAAEKNMAVLIKAFAMLRKDLKAKLWIIGDGPERPHLESLAATLNVVNDVDFVGFQNNLYKFIKRSDVFVHTSLFEGFGNIILEAMACGVPVIATDCPFGPREIISNMNNGILVPVSDEVALMEAFKKVIEDHDLRTKLIDGARKCLIDFSTEKMVKQYEDVFLKIYGEDLE